MRPQALWMGLLCVAGAAQAQVPPVDGLAAPMRARLTAQRDSLVAIGGGARVGWLRMVRTPLADGGLRYVETIQVEDAVELLTAVTADSGLVLRRLVQSGEAWDQSLAVALQVEGERLRGSATRPGRPATLVTRDDPRPTRPELTLVPVLVAATPWSPGQAGTWRVHDAAAGADVTVAVAVEAFEPASPAGPAAWRILVRTGTAVTRYRVTADAPWRIVSIATEGMPFRFSAP